jgi:D-glycero-D-manno-heptose 1,7-bisphosphate phosphatase
MNRAVFLDRDGTINELVNGNAPLKFEDFKFLPDVDKAIKELKKMNFKIVIVSNQPDVAKGNLTLENLNKMDEKIKSVLEVDAIYYCIHHPSITGYCECRKPKSGLIDKACKDLDLDVFNSYIIGDRISDIEAGKKCKKRFLISNGKEKFNEIKPDFIVKSLLEAVEIIKVIENGNIY